jgi:branched-chain amino acid aminotransferase
MSYINLNGKILEGGDPVLQADNRAFRYGYGLFETMLVRDGAIQLKEYHWARLWEGFERLRFSIPKLFKPSSLETEILRTVSKNKLDSLCRVRLQVFPGNGGLYDGGSFAPEYLVECFPLEEHLTRLNEAGLVLGIATGVTKTIDTTANLKTCNALIYAMAARQAKENKWNDAFIVNTRSYIIETAISNLFWIKNDKIYTPPLSEGCIAGVMRAHILDRAAEKHVEIGLKPLSVEALIGADEVFLTNAIRHIKWVRNIGDTTLTNKAIQRFSAIIF